LRDEGEDKRTGLGTPVVLGDNDECHRFDLIHKGKALMYHSNPPQIITYYKLRAII